ncbi:Mur ligase domain-containing protein, partial [Pseudobutyrivibrio sp.]|uniref:Mur ligase domain-containing protein n=1 Tax=Pseudobutyrivibrio sp. TaxID=2014367 RepID=UPI001B6A2CFE
MKLTTLLEELDYELYAGELDKEISTLVYDSRKVEKDSVFVCISGTVRDAHDFIPDVIEKGATAIIIEKDVEPVAGVTYIKVKNSRQALAILSAAYFGHPA